MSKISKNPKERHFKAFGDQRKFLSRITKTLYYGKLPTSDRLSLPVTEYASELFSEAQNGRSLERLHCNDAAAISRNACISPCSFILAMLYLERLKNRNNDYLLQVTPSELFLVSLMVSSKFLYDDGEEDEVFIDEWANSGGMSIKELAQLEKNFLKAIDWEVFVNEATFWTKLKQLETIIAKRTGSMRGWFTYTELESLLVNVDIQAVTQYVASLTAILIITYAVGILTILSSMFIVSHLPGNFLQQQGVQNLTTLSSKDGNENSTVADFEYHFKCENPKKQLDTVGVVLKTGLLLASIKSVDRNSDCNKSYLEPEPDVNNNVHVISWDWWSSPSMEWLTSISKMIQKFDFIPEFRFYLGTDSTLVNSKMIDLEDQVHKATKTRIQDQLERSWHEEWTDTIKGGVFVLQPFNFLRNVKT